MYGYKKHFRSFYLERSVDQALERRAEAEGIPKGMLVRRYLREGLGMSPPPERQSSPPFRQGERERPFILRSFYLEEELAAAFASRASMEGIPQAELGRRLIDAGLSGPIQPQAPTRLYEFGLLQRSHAAYLLEAQEAARRYLEAAERIHAELVRELQALRACCPHERVIELKGAVALHGCPCSDLEHFRHATCAGLCVDCGTFEGICLDTDARYRRLSPKDRKDVGFDEFVRVRAGFLAIIDDR